MPGSSWVPIYLRILSANPTVILTKVIIRRVIPVIQMPLVTPPWKLWQRLPQAPGRAGFWTNWTYSVLKSGLRESWIRSGNCLWSGSICSPAATRTWERCLWLNIILSSPIRHFSKSARSKYPTYVWCCERPSLGNATYQCLLKIIQPVGQCSNGSLKEEWEPEVLHVNLRKLNNQTVKDAYSLAKINEALISLQEDPMVLLT